VIALKSMVHCGSAFEPGASGLPCYFTPPVYVPAVIGALAVWRQNIEGKKKSDRGEDHSGAPCILVGYCGRPSSRSEQSSLVEALTTIRGSSVGVRRTDAAPMEHWLSNSKTSRTPQGNKVILLRGPPGNPLRRGTQRASKKISR